MLEIFFKNNLRCFRMVSQQRPISVWYTNTVLLIKNNIFLFFNIKEKNYHVIYSTEALQDLI